MYLGILGYTSRTWVKVLSLLVLIKSQISRGVSWRIPRLIWKLTSIGGGKQNIYTRLDLWKVLIGGEKRRKSPDLLNRKSSLVGVWYINIPDYWAEKVILVGATRNFYPTKLKCSMSKSGEGVWRYILSHYSKHCFMSLGNSCSKYISSKVTGCVKCRE